LSGAWIEQGGCHCHSLSLIPVNPDWYVYLPGFTFPVPAHLGSPGQIPEGCKTVVVVVLVVRHVDMSVCRSGASDLGDWILLQAVPQVLQ